MAFLKKFSEFLLEKNNLVGGKADKLTTAKLAMMYSVPEKVIIKELKLGMSIEKEHTTNIEDQKEIALDHISEFIDYYSNKRYGIVAIEKKREKK